VISVVHPILENFNFELLVEAIVDHWGMLAVIFACLWASRSLLLKGCFGQA
jgi:hypothetical protein